MFLSDAPELSVHRGGPAPCPDQGEVSNGPETTWTDTPSYSSGEPSSSRGAVKRSFAATEDGGKKRLKLDTVPDGDEKVKLCSCDCNVLHCVFVPSRLMSWR